MAQRAPAASADLSGPIAKDRSLTIYLSTQAVSLVGDAFSATAFPLLVLQATGSVAQMGAVSAVEGVAMSIGGCCAGPIADRWSSRRLIFACDVFRGSLNLLIPLCWLAGPQIWLLYAVAGLSAMGAVFFSAAHTNLITRLADRDRLTATNGLYQAAGAIAWMIGPAAAASVAATFGLTAAIALNSVSFTVSAVGVLFTRLPQFPGRQEKVPTEGGHGFVAGFSFVWRQPVLRGLLVLTAVTSMFVYGLINLFIFHVRSDLHQSATIVGLMLSGAAAGAVIAAVAASPLRRRLGFTICWAVAFFVAGLATVAVGFITYIPVIPIIAAFFAAGISLGSVCSISLRQEMTPAHLMGRTASLSFTVNRALGAAGAIVLTATAGIFGTRPVGVFVGVALMFTAALSFLFTPSK